MHLLGWISLQFYSGVIFVSILLLSSQSPAQPGEEKTSFHQSNNTARAEGQTSQGSVVRFRTTFTLEASLFCVPRATTGPSELCDL
jgi:hypothetical protein